MATDRINGVVFDVEIINCIPEKKGKKNPAFKYCAGWFDHKGMGVACICAYDMWERRPRVFTKGNFGEFVKLCKMRDEIIGFNSLRFDDKVLQAAQLDIKTTYDLMDEVKLKTGEPIEYDRFKSRGGHSLDQLCIDNGLPGKPPLTYPNGEPMLDVDGKPMYLKGDMAPKMWQAGQHGAVIDYCLSDVMMLFNLLRKRSNIRVGSYDKFYSLRDLPSLRVEAAAPNKVVVEITSENPDDMPITTAEEIPSVIDETELPDQVDSEIPET